MYGNETIDSFFKVREAGFDYRQAAELTGVSISAGWQWSHGKFPHSYTGKYRFSCRILSPKNQMIGDIMAEKKPYEKLWDEGRWKEMSPLEIENMLLKELLDYLKVIQKCKELISKKQKNAFGESIRRAKGLPLHIIVTFLNISKSTYEYHKKHPAKDKDTDIREEVKRLFNEGHATLGYRRICAKLRSKNIYVSEKRVRRVMKQEGLEVIYIKKRRRGYSSYAGEISKAPKNLVKRNFHADRPNELWLTDITEFKLPNGQKVYLSPVIDCFDGAPISYSIGYHPTAQLANLSLLKALDQRKGQVKTVIHSDRGCHYRWPKWVEICNENNLVRSMSAKGCSPDNSACEGFFGTVKNEFFYYRNWENVSGEEFIERLEAYLEYYCEDRIKQSLGWLSPNKFRRSLNYVA